MSMYPYRMASGWITKAALQASSTYLLSNFTRQADQLPHILWTMRIPAIEDALIISEGTSGVRKGFGKAKTFLIVPILTPAMYDFWIDRFWVAGTQSAPVTFEVPDFRQPSASRAAVYQCYIHKPTTAYRQLVRATFWQDTQFEVTRLEQQF